ncbi:TlpA family protein disulfide reductase [Bacillus sp. 1P06AnD]|uniref:TlpA family protein disulfide reductase n=1 Tax=Bacillus sp. 1P06AnD TaxID=3132208 RepID=UPI0039A21628
MAKKIIAASILLILIGAAIVQAMDRKEDLNQEKMPGLEKGMAAPNFTLKNLDGKEVQLSSLKGKNVIINFWATWCPPCKEEMPDLQKFYAEYGQNVELLAINNDPYNDVKGFAGSYGITFPVLLEDKTHVSETYEIIAFPSTYFIDKKGNIAYKHIGQITYEQLKKQYKKM